MRNIQQSDIISWKIKKIQSGNIITEFEIDCKQPNHQELISNHGQQIINLQKRTKNVKVDSNKQQQSKEQTKKNDNHNLQSELEKYFEVFDTVDIKHNLNLSNFSSFTPRKTENNYLGSNPQTKEKTDERQNSNEQQEQYKRYKQLTGKLKNTLDSIQFSKYTTQRIRLNVDQIDKMNDRFEFYQKKKKQNLQMKIKEIEQQKFKQLKLKPNINKSSLLLKTEPIYKRYQKIVQLKNKKIDQQRKKKQLQKEKEYEEFMKIFVEKNKKPENMRNNQQFYQQLIKWKTKKQNKIKQKFDQEKKKQFESYSFKPIINQKSKKILLKTQRQSIFDRQPKPPKKNIQQFSFKPQINKRPLKKI